MEFMFHAFHVERHGSVGKARFELDAWPLVLSVMVVGFLVRGIFGLVVCQEIRSP